MKKIELKHMIREELLREGKNEHFGINDVPGSVQKTVRLACKILRVNPDSSDLDIFGDEDEVQVDLKIKFSGWSYLSADQLEMLSKIGVKTFMFDREHVAFIMKTGKGS